MDPWARTHFWRKSIIVLACLLLLVSCRKKDKGTDAYGVFEATEIIVSSENNGKLLEFSAEEGKTYQQGDVLGHIDSTQLCLQIRQLESSIRATLASRPDIPSQLNTLEAKLQTLQRERNRGISAESQQHHRSGVFRSTDSRGDRHHPSSNCINEAYFVRSNPVCAIYFCASPRLRRTRSDSVP